MAKKPDLFKSCWPKPDPLAEQMKVGRKLDCLLDELHRDFILRLFDASADERREMIMPIAKARWGHG